MVAYTFFTVELIRLTRGHQFANDKDFPTNVFYHLISNNVLFFVWGEVVVPFLFKAFLYVPVKLQYTRSSTRLVP